MVRVSKSRPWNVTISQVNTILNLPYSGFEVVECQVADLVFQRIEIHCEKTCNKNAIEAFSEADSNSREKLQS